MRRRFPEQEENPERWMVSYADFITLLFGFFVVMYAISSVNDDKYRVLSATLKQAFNVEILSPDLIQIGEPTLAASPHVVDIPDSHAHADTAEGDTFIKDPVDAARSLLGGFAQTEGISVHSSTDWLELQLTSSLLFAPGQTRLSTGAQDVLAGLLPVLRVSSHPITVEGYTDNVTAASDAAATNWLLSAARASAVADYFVRNGIRQERIAAVGYGENHPLQTNATPAGRAANRRVVVVVARRADGARNRNSDTARVPVRSAEEAEAIEGERTEAGGLLFSNVSQEPAAAQGQNSGANP